MRIGKLRFLVTVESETTAIDASGAATRTWTQVGQAWADMLPVSATEEWRNAQTQLRATHRIVMRYAPWLHEKCRIRHGSRTWYISRLRNLEEGNHTHELYAWEDTGA